MTVLSRFAAAEKAFAFRGGLVDAPCLAPTPIARLRGAVHLPRALDAHAQLALARLCLRCLIEPPAARRNIDAFLGLAPTQPPPRAWRGRALPSSGGLWAAFVAAHAGGGAARPAPLALDALTWASVGARYDWDARAYEARDGAPLVPPLVRALCAGALRASDTPSIVSSPFTPHSGILNLYRGGARGGRLPMGSHRDDAAGEDITAPVVSFSLGAPGLFLLGGDTEEDEPTPLLLHSGDVFILTGDARTAVHGVPRIYPQAWEGVSSDQGLRLSPLALEEWGGGEAACAEGSTEEEAALRTFLSTRRINLSVRQLTR